MTEVEAVHPKLFISYSWSSPEHEAWVEQFANELAGQGVEVIFDKWDLQPGHDAYAFMEAIVTDETVNKVVLICDELYVKKSNDRSGGAGTEAQIITPKLYSNVKQDKFVAIAMSRDEGGKAYLPAYYGGRIYIDFTDPSSRSTEFDRIVRWAWGKPLYERPPMGRQPSFLARGAILPKIDTSIAFRRAMDAIRNHSPYVDGGVREYLEIVSAGLEHFRIFADRENFSSFDDLVIKNIEEFAVFRNELAEMFLTASANEMSSKLLRVFHNFFEALIPYLHRPETASDWIEQGSDNYRFIVHELFLCFIGSLLKYERFESVTEFLDTQYYVTAGRGRRGDMESFHVFREYMETLRTRNSRLDLGRVSLRADMLKSRAAGRGLEFRHLMTADFVLYLRSQIDSEFRRFWWPETLVYADRFGGTFELFTRSQSRSYFGRVMVMFFGKSKSELNELIRGIESDRDRVPRWDYSSLNVREHVGFEALATKP